MNVEAVRRAGAELVTGVISAETMRAISDVGISKDDYRDMVNTSFQGGLVAKAKTIAIGMKALRSKAERRKP